MEAAQKQAYDWMIHPIGLVGQPKKRGAGFPEHNLGFTIQVFFRCPVVPN